MNPLREVPTVPKGVFYSPEKTYFAPDNEREIPAPEVTGVYLDFLDSLNPLQRNVLAEKFYPQTTGMIAEKVGLTDVEVHLVATCGNDPYPWKDSAQVKAIEEDLENRWENFSVAAGCARPKSEQPNDWHTDQVRIRRGFERLVAEIIYGDYGDDKLTEDSVPYIIELLKDGPRLRELVAQWYEENYEARMLERSRKFGNVVVAAEG